VGIKQMPFRQVFGLGGTKHPLENLDASPWITASHPDG